MGWAHTIPSATFVRNCRLGSLSTGSVSCRSSRTCFLASDDDFVNNQVNAMPINAGGSTACVVGNSESTTIRLSDLLLPCVRVRASHWFSGETIGETSAFVHPKSVHHRLALMRLVVQSPAYQRNAETVRLSPGQEDERKLSPCNVPSWGGRTLYHRLRL